MGYNVWSVVFGEQPSASKWNTLGSNDASFNDGTGLPSNNSASAVVLTSQTTASAGFTDLTTSGPAVTVTIGAGGKALVTVSASMSNNTSNAGCLMGYVATVSNAIAASDDRALLHQNPTAANGMSASWSYLHTGLTAGSTTFTSKYRVNAGTGTFLRRYISVVTL